VERVRTAQDVADAVRTARTTRGWTQQEAADAAGVSRRFVNMVEGVHPTAELGRVLDLLDALEIHLTAALTTDDAATTTTAPARPNLDPDELDLDAYLSSFRTTQAPHR